MTPARVVDVIRDFPQDARTRCTGQVLLATGSEAEQIKAFSRNGEGYVS